MNLSSKGKPNAVGPYKTVTIPWKRANTWLIETEDEMNNLIVGCVMGGFREMESKTSLSEWAGISGYRVDESFEYKVLWKKTYLGNGESTYDKYIFSKNPSKRGRKRGEGSRSFEIVRNDFESRYGVGWKQNFGVLKYNQDLWKDCCVSPITYCNEDEDIQKHTLKGVRKCDVSSAYPAQANDTLPTYTGHKKVKGYAEPTAEYPFAFYIKSHHMAIYNELDTRTFLERGKRVGYKNYNSDEKYDRWAVNVPEEEEITYLLKKAEIGLGELYSEYYNTKQMSIDEEEYEESKMILNSSLGFMGSYKFNKLFYCPYIYAVIKARHTNRMLDIINNIKGIILMVLTDSVIWLGEESSYQTTEKTLGAFVDELQSMDTYIWYRNYGQYSISVGGTIKFVKTQGLEQTQEIKDRIAAMEFVGDLEYILPPDTAKHEAKYKLFGGVYG